MSGYNWSYGIEGALAKHVKHNINEKYIGGETVRLTGSTVEREREREIKRKEGMFRP